MINLYAARENIDKERFVFEHIAGETIVIVPNQYTLAAEEQAIKYLGRKCLFDVEIVSMNRLGLRILTEQGLESTKMLDRYGRFMLLNRIIKAHRDDLNIFAKSAGKITFTSMVNDFISDFKQQNCSMDAVKEMLEGTDADGLLKDKLKALESIVQEYELAIEGKYTDSEDYIAMYVDAIKKSELISGKSVWIYGYDSITPKFMNAMFELSERGKELNFIINRSDFYLDDNLVKGLTYEGRDRGIEIKYEEIGSEYALEKSETIARIERGLFNDELSAEKSAENESFIPEDLTIVRAANPYYEAESAACYIYHLVRDLGYKMRDIQVIANDEGMMQPIVRRTFEEYGLPVFMDQSRNITDTAAVNFIVNLLVWLRYGGKTDALMALLKTELAGVDRDDVSTLENYARIYRIKGSMWKRPFKYGAEAYGEEFEKLEELRAKLASSLGKLEELADGTVSEFVDKFIRYLETEWNLSAVVEAEADRQTAKGLHEEAQRAVEGYRAALKLLDQIAGIMDDEAFEINEFMDIYMTGLTNVEVGVIPPTADGLSMGTMIRTRPRDTRAIIVLGANEGTLPLQPSSEGLFSVDEKAYFKDKGFALGVLDDIKMVEEQVAMYRMLSKPSEKLYISYSMTDIEGNEAAPSTLLDSLIELFPRLERDGLIRKDVISAGWSEKLVNSTGEAMRHLFNHLKDRRTGSKMDELTAALMSWYENNNCEEYEPMVDAVKDENDPVRLGADVARGLYAGKDDAYRLSASSISSYFDCPFKYFVDRGLRPEEERAFSDDSRSIGDVYHRCLMEIADRIIGERSYANELIDCDDEELNFIVGEKLKEIAADYREGLFESNDIEEYRLNRMIEICSAAVRAMAIQLAAGSVTDAKFEESFGRGKRFKPIELEVNGSRFFVEGQIDRVDIMGNRARIVDYKTGSDKLDTGKMAQGYKMQLMIYMMSVMKDGYEPAGMFYFNIKDPIQKFDGVDETAVKDGMAKKDEPLSEYYKLKGKFVDDEGVLDSMPPEVLAKSKGEGISRKDFDELKASVEERISEIAGGISTGEIGIHPLKNDGNRLVCSYCDYRAICKRDRNYVRNMARELKGRKDQK